MIVTGAGRGIGREHALELARQGAKVVVNDLGVSNSGEGGGQGPADEVVQTIRDMGGEAVANGADVADWAQTEGLVRQAIDEFGRLDAVVNNAGFVRDRMFVSCSEEEWDAVIRVHLKGHFCVARHAAAYWRGQVKAGEEVDARIINTTSGAGVLGSIGQSSYSAAKAGIATLTLVQAAELGRYGITANAICPIARTRMTEGAFADAMKAPDEGFDENDPANVSPFIAWLASSGRWSQKKTRRPARARAASLALRIPPVATGRSVSNQRRSRGRSSPKSRRWLSVGLATGSSGWPR